MLAYMDIGEGTPILFIHGLGSRKEAWMPQFPLSDKYRLILPDLRGHGETEVEDNISLEQFAKDIWELLDKLQIESVYVCGLSLGGVVAQELYRQAAARINGLILANTTSYISPFFAKGILRQASESYLDNAFAASIAERGIYNRSYFEEAKNAFLIRPSYLAAAKAPVGTNYLSLLPKISKPVLLIGSTHDRVTPLMNLYTMQWYLKQARTAILPFTGHLSNIEQKEAFNRHIDQFIQENE